MEIFSLTMSHVQAEAFENPIDFSGWGFLHKNYSRNNCAQLKQSNTVGFFVLVLSVTFLVAEIWTPAKKYFCPASASIFQQQVTGWRASCRRLLSLLLARVVFVFSRSLSAKPYIGSTATKLPTWLKGWERTRWSPFRSFWKGK